MALQDRLIEARKKKGLTQEELGKLVDAGVSTIRKWESGINAPNGNKLVKLMNVLEVDANFLYQDALKDLDLAGWVEKEVFTTAELMKKLSTNFSHLDMSLKPFAEELTIYTQSTEFQWFANCFLKLDSKLQSQIMELTESILFLMEREEEEEVTPTESNFFYIDYYPVNRPSAGTGNLMLDDETPVSLKIRKTPRSSKASFAVQVDGKSMEPKFKDGDIVLVKRDEMPENGEVGIFMNEDTKETFIKEKREGILYSINRSYPDIIPSGNMICIGKVLGKAPL